MRISKAGAFCAALVLSLAAAAHGAIGISSIEELQKIGNEPDYPLDGHYYLTQDIDASETEDWNDGAGFEPIGPDGDTTFAGTFDGPGPFEVAVRSGGDAMFEVSSSGGRTRLDPKGGFRGRGFRMRHGNDVRSGFRYDLRAPQEGDAVKVALEWAGAAASQYEGSAASASLEDLEGNPVAEARWVVPVGTVFDEGGKARPAQTEGLLLSVPPEHRGQGLRLTVVAPTKDLCWQVQGLDEPWLAIEPGAFSGD